MRLAFAIALALLLPSSALAATSGGASYPPSAGGTSYGAASTSRPTVAAFRVQSRVRAPRLPVVRFRIDEPGTSAVRTRIAVLPIGRGTGPLSVELGRQATGTTVTVRWPRGTRLAAGRYLVRLHAVDDVGRTLVRPAYASGRATLTVLPKPRPKAKPKPVTPAAPVTPVAPVAPAAPVAPPVVPAGPTTAGVFPVAGPHTYGDGVGAARTGHTHEGQDILAADGVPIVAPVAGTIFQATYQAHAAGYYIVLKGDDGRDFFFAHCQKDSFAVAAGARVAAGGPLCKVGRTGDASGPHLHFEIWVGGWRTGGHFIDPLPQLRAWDR